MFCSLSTLDTSKVTGPDRISAHMLKATAGAIAPSVTALMNIPTEWRKSPICASSKNIFSYHPKWLLTYLPFEYPKQSARIAPSFQTIFLATVDNWLKILEQGCEIGAVFFDVRKVFDSVPHKALMSKLQQTGLNSNILAWVGNYLTCRRQTAVVNGSRSSDSLFYLRCHIKVQF